MVSVGLSQFVLVSEVLIWTTKQGQTVFLLKLKEAKVKGKNVYTVFMMCWAYLQYACTNVRTYVHISICTALMKLNVYNTYVYVTDACLVLSRSVYCHCRSDSEYIDMEYVDKVRAEATWPVWSAQVFHKFNAFMERCNDLHEITSTILHFK